MVSLREDLEDRKDGVFKKKKLSVPPNPLEKMLGTYDFSNLPQVLHPGKRLDEEEK